MNTLLIVDDEPSARETLLSMLNEMSYSIETARNGPDALQKAERIQPDLILLDVMMPDMDGFEVCRRIRSTPMLAEVPIVILTALDDRVSLLQGIEAGADDFLTKPVDRHELRARVHTITRLNRYRTLMSQRQNVSILAERVVTAQEQERRRISLELHDDLGQALTMQMLDIRKLQKTLSVPDTELFKQLEALFQQSYQISIKIRTLAQGIHPPVLDALGLEGALQSYCADFAHRTNLPVTFQADETIPALSDLCNITLYRILQEALTNIYKHARASNVWVDLSLEDQLITLTVQDDGHGFDGINLQSRGIGLKGLRGRLAIVGGTFKISSSKGRGTILTAQIPLPDGSRQKEAE